MASLTLGSTQPVQTPSLNTASEGEENSTLLGDQSLQAFADENGTTVDQLFRDNPNLTYLSNPGTPLVVNSSSSGNTNSDINNTFNSQTLAFAPNGGRVPGPKVIGPPPANQNSVNSTRTYNTYENVINFSRADHNADIGGTQTWTRVVQATPYYVDANGDQQMLRVGEKAPSSARNVYYGATETVLVRQLEGKELGTLEGKSPAQIKTMLAEQRSNQEQNYRAGNVPNPDTKKPFASLEDARQYSRGQHYYGSGPHLAAARAAEARTGGRIPAKWFMENDPFMGRAGSNAEYFPNRGQGLYPGITAKIGVAHDTDYGLGAMFGAGPLSGLSRTRAPLGGMEGLLPNQQESENNQALAGLARNGKDYPQYGTGHKDWNVTSANNADAARH